MAGNTVTLRFVGDTRDIQRSFDVVGDGAARTESRFAKFSSRMKGLAGVVGTAIAVDFARKSIDAFKESEQAQNKLEQAFARFPGLAETNIESFRKLNTELAKKTRFDDDATASAQAQLAQFKLTGNQIKTLTPLVQDYAAKTGKDLTTAAQDVGKALQGKGRALVSVGLNLKDTGSLAGNFAQTVSGLRDQVGGFAEKEGKTAAGQSEILKNQFGELQEKVGSVLVPALTKLADKLLEIIDAFQKLPTWVQTAIGVLVGLAAAVFLVSRAIQAWTVAQAALNVVLALNPIGLVVLAVVAVGVALYVAYQKSESFRNAVDAAGRAGKAAIGWIIDKVETLVEWFKKAIDWAGRLIDKVSHIPGAGALKSGLKAAIPGLGLIPGFATGGTVPGPIGAPMLAVVHGGERVQTPAQQQAAGGGNTIHIYMPPGSDGDDVVDAIKRYERRNGTGWRS